MEAGPNGTRLFCFGDRCLRNAVLNEPFPTRLAFASMALMRFVPQRILLLS
jgi:hypothetical protein